MLSGNLIVLDSRERERDWFWLRLFLLEGRVRTRPSGPGCPSRSASSVTAMVERLLRWAREREFERDKIEGVWGSERGSMYDFGDRVWWACVEAIVMCASSMVAARGKLGVRGVTVRSWRLG